jgi:hypothetical protein
MIIVKDIQEYAELRTKARAYMCYIMSRSIANSPTLEQVFENLDALQESLPTAEAIYALDKNGIQIIDNISRVKKHAGLGKGEDRNQRAYYYKTFKEHRCILTEPYPSLLSNELVVTSSFPLYDENNELLAIICIDISLKNILKIINPSSSYSLFGSTSRVVYAAFSVALFSVAMLLFLKGVFGFMSLGLDIKSIDINEIFKSTILLTLSLAIADLVKAIFEEEVLRKEKKQNHSENSHETMTRFLGSIIIALSIEALMLVFKFALTSPDKLLYAVYLLFGITSLILALSVYLKVNQKN